MQPFSYRNIIQAEAAHAAVWSKRPHDSRLDHNYVCLLPLIGDGAIQNAARITSIVLGLDHLVPNGIPHKLGDRADAEFFHDGGAMGFDGLDADPEQC